MRRGSGDFTEASASLGAMTEEEKRKSAKLARRTIRRKSLQSADSTRSLFGHKEGPGKQVSDKRRTQIAASGQQPPGLSLDGVAEHTPRGGGATERDERDPPPPADAALEAEDSSAPAWVRV